MQEQVPKLQKISNSRKFRLAKIKCFTVVLIFPYVYKGWSIFAYGFSNLYNVQIWTDPSTHPSICTNAERKYVFFITIKIAQTIFFNPPTLICAN